MEIITVATILLASLNTLNDDRGFVYNTEGSEDVVTATVIYKKSESGKYLSHHLKYNYTYDEQQRLVKKEALRWSSLSEKWEKSYCLNYEYDSFGYSIEYALWDKYESDYSDVIAKQTYDETIDGAVAVVSYKWDKSDKNWVVKDNVLMMNSGNTLLPSLELGFTI